MLLSEMLSKELHPDDELLIIASDGIWEFITNQEAVDIVDRYEDPLEACKHLVAEAYKMWMIHDVRTDDITGTLSHHLKDSSKRFFVCLHPVNNSYKYPFEMAEQD